MPLGRARTAAPFLGLGSRSYNHRKLEVDATHNLTVYGSDGSEFGLRRVQLRVEVRDYVSSFKPLLGGGKAVTRNDVMVMVGLRFTKA